MRITTADGASLPPIPDEIVAYKNIVVFKSTLTNSNGENYYRICGSNYPMETFESSDPFGTFVYHGLKAGPGYRAGGAYPSYSEWTVSSLEDSGANNDYLKNVVWANYAVLNLDGSVYLAASVSPVKLNPALLVQSFFTGQAVRRNRT